MLEVAARIPIAANGVIDKTAEECVPDIGLQVDREELNYHLSCSLQLEVLFALNKEDSSQILFPIGN